MKSKFKRYTPAMMRSLGYFIDHEEKPLGSASLATKEFFDKFVRGKFRDMLNLLYNSDNGSLDSDIQKYVSPNAPSEVREFVNNILLTPVNAINSAPNDDIAFDCIIPRDCQCRSLLAPHIESLKRDLRYVRQRYAARVNPQSKTD